MSLRIWSPSAAGAEIVEALGRGDQLVAADARPQVVIRDGDSEPVKAPGARIITIAPARVAEIEATIVELAAAIGASPQAPEVIESIQKPIESVLAAVVNRPRPAVFIDMPAAWIPDMAGMAGGQWVGAPQEADLVVVADGASAPQPITARVVAVDPAYYAVAGPRVAYGIVQLGFLLHPDRLNDPQLPLRNIEAGAGD